MSEALASSSAPQGGVLSAPEAALDEPPDASLAPFAVDALIQRCLGNLATADAILTSFEKEATDTRAIIEKSTGKDAKVIRLATRAKAV